MYLFTIFFLFNWKYLILLLSIYIFLFHRFPNYVSVKSKLQHAPPRAYPGHLTPLPSRGAGGGNLIIRVFQGVGIWSPCFRGGEFELHPQFHVKSLAWQAVMGDAVLEDFRGKDCAFVANWFRGLCRIWRYLNFNIFIIGFRLWINECIKLSF